MARKPWDELIKQQLKQEVGLGWTICCHKRSEGYSSGRVKLTRRDQRTAAQLGDVAVRVGLQERNENPGTGWWPSLSRWNPTHR